jgi:hypothetical protein
MNRLSKIAALNVATAAAPGAPSQRKAIAETCPEKLLFLFPQYSLKIMIALLSGLNLP